MRADDPRHGTNAGYMVHALSDRNYCEPCREAHAAYHRSLWRRRYVLGVDSLYIDATGIRRRIQALHALGWRYTDIDTAAGVKTGWSKNATTHSRVNITQAMGLLAAYDHLSMKLGPSPKNRTWAQRKGWLPPLAWDDDTIDDPRAQPHCGIETSDVAADLDHAIVERFLGGEYSLLTTPAEKREIVRRWPGSQSELGRRTGWNVTRYTDSEEGAA